MQDPDGARYEDAYPAFKRAYELSGSLNALQNLAICAMKIELDGEAIVFFERFLEAKGDDIEEADKAQVTRDLNTLKAVVAWITVSSDDAGVTMQDVRTPRRGATVRNKYDIGIQAKKLGVHPGSHVFTAKNGEGQEQTWTVEIANGGEYNHEFVFDPNAPVTAEGFTMDDPKPEGEGEGEDDEEGGGIHPAVWGGLGVTIAAAGVMAAFMGLSASQKKKYDNDILGQEPVSVQESEASKLKTYNLVADIMIGVTAAAAVTTLVLGLVLTTDEEEAETGGVHWTVAPSLDHRGGGAMITGSF
jgi:hypothetical protein